VVVVAGISERMPSNFQPKPISAIVLMISQKCNLRCTYCYGTDGSYGNEMQMDQEIAFQAIDWFIEHAGDEKKLRIVFLGGEPLMNYPLMKAVAAYSKRQAEVCHKSVGFEITTNGTLITEEVIRFFKKYNIVPCISFDGPREVQDLQRPFINGRGSYAPTVPRIRRLLETIPEASCRATWLEGTDPAIVMQELREIGFRKIMLIPVSMAPDLNCTIHSDSDSDEYLPFIQTFARESGDFLRFIKDRDPEAIRQVITDTVLWNLTERVVGKIKKFTPCGAGLELAAVSANGDLYPCHRFTGYPAYKIGNISSSAIDRAFNQWNTVDEIPICNECAIRYHCAGGCYHDNMVNTGDHRKPWRGSCERKKAMMAITEELAAQLTSSDLEFLYEEKFFKRPHCLFDFSVD
jgi:uncharacterized protein